MPVRFALKEGEHVSMERDSDRFHGLVRWRQKILDPNKVTIHFAFIVRVLNFPAPHKFSCLSANIQRR
jgi:hypothetical protein